MNEEEFITKFYSCDNEEQFLKDVNHNLNCLQKVQNNWNELKKWLEEEIKEYQKDKYSGDYGLVLGFIRVVQQKVQELEQGKDE